MWSGKVLAKGQWLRRWATPSSGSKANGFVHFQIEQATSRLYMDSSMNFALHVAPNSADVLAEYRGDLEEDGAPNAASRPLLEDSSLFLIGRR